MRGGVRVRSGVPRQSHRLYYDPHHLHDRCCVLRSDKRSTPLRGAPTCRSSRSNIAAASKERAFSLKGDGGWWEGCECFCVSERGNQPHWGATRIVTVVSLACVVIGQVVLTRLDVCGPCMAAEYWATSIMAISLIVFYSQYNRHPCEQPWSIAGVVRTAAEQPDPARLVHLPSHGLQNHFRRQRRSVLLGALVAVAAPPSWALAQDPPAAVGKEDKPSLAPIKSVIVDHHPSQEMLKLLEVEDWPIWTCEESQVSQSYSVDEDCYLLEGDVVIIPAKGPQVEIKAGDFVTFPKGFNCVWDVRKPVVKRYKQLAALVDDSNAVEGAAGPGVKAQSATVIT